MQKMTAKAIKDHLALPDDFDPEVHEHHRLTLDRTQTWWKVECPEGHAHLLSMPEAAETTFECDGCGSAKYTVTPSVKG